MLLLVTFCYQLSQCDDQDDDDDDGDDDDDDDDDDKNNNNNNNNNNNMIYFKAWASDANFKHVNVQWGIVILTLFVVNHTFLRQIDQKKR